MLLLNILLLLLLWFLGMSLSQKNFFFSHGKLLCEKDMKVSEVWDEKWVWHECGHVI